MVKMDMKKCFLARKLGRGKSFPPSFEGIALTPES